MNTNDEKPKGRQYADIEPIEKIQICNWYKHLLEYSRSASSNEFQKWIDQKGVSDSSLDNVEWSAYKKGVRKPSEKTLLAVEELINGSIAVYQNGDATLPLISVLNGSIVDCEKHLIEVLAEYKLYKLNMSLMDKCEALFNLMIAKSLVIDETQKTEDELAGLVVGGFYSIKEIMAFSNNLVSASFEVGMNKLNATRFDSAKPLIYGEFKILHKRVVLAALALIQICLVNRIEKDIAYYLVDGVSANALTVLFGKDIHDYVVNEFE